MSSGNVVGRIGPQTDVPIIHAITNDEVVARPDFIDQACAVMRVLGNRGALHLRANRLTGARFQQLAEGLAAAQGLTGGWLVVNDRIDVALVSGAKGAQLTSRSLTTGDARRVAPDLAIGASVHDAAEGRAAADAGADWLVAGQIFATLSHAGEVPRGVEWVRMLTRSTKKPVLAIGGVRVEHVVALREAGVHGVAVIRGIWDAPNAEQAASDYLSAYGDDGGTPSVNGPARRGH
jgi:thiazole tautomerase (transcriptional regulator TenI)